MAVKSFIRLVPGLPRCLSSAKLISFLPSTVQNVLLRRRRSGQISRVWRSRVSAWAYSRAGRAKGAPLRQALASLSNIRLGCEVASARAIVAGASMTLHFLSDGHLTSTSTRSLPTLNPTPSPTRTFQTCHRRRGWSSWWNNCKTFCLYHWQSEKLS